jgi:hypothetical protein
VLGYTELVNDVRHDARSQLHLDVQRLGAEGVVIADVSLQIRERGYPVQERQRDHIAEAPIIGTAIAWFSRAAAAGPVEPGDNIPGPATPAGGAHGRDSMTREEANRAVRDNPAIVHPLPMWPVEAGMGAVEDQ